MADPYEIAGKRIYVAGHRGMVGSALVRRLEREECEILTAPREIDLRDQGLVQAWFAENRPDAVLLAAAKVGGIAANDSRPAEFIYDNLMIEANLIEAARQHDIGKLLFLASSCIYPRDAAQPIAEEALLTGPLEPTNQWYAIAKIAGIKLCQAYRRQYGCRFISVMPTNLYGPGDNYDLETSHVLPALIRKAHEAKLAGDPALTIWGTGTPLREFLHVDDLADACIFLLRGCDEEEPVNIGSGEEVSILELARLVAAIVGFSGEVENDPSRPDGTPRKLLDCSKLQGMGWRAKIGLREGIAETYRDFLQQADS